MRGMRFAARLALPCLLAACMAGPAWAGTLTELKGRFEQEKDRDFTTRYATLREIAELGTLEALRFLEHVSVEDADPGIRWNAFFVMAQVPLPEAAEALLKAFWEREKERSSILAAWTSYRKEPLPAQIVDEVLSRTDIGMRSSIVRYLGTQCDARFLPEARRSLSQFPAQAPSVTSALIAQPSPEADQLLLEVYDDGRVWKPALQHWLDMQNEDGGWNYVPQSRKDASSSSMTAAGVSSLLICLENGEPSLAERTTAEAALERGFSALGTQMRLDKDSLYTLYGIERASVLGRRSSLAGKPWYAPGALRILDEQGADGLWTGPYARPVDAAIAILFLKKATTPLAPVVTR